MITKIPLFTDEQLVKVRAIWRATVQGSVDPDCGERLAFRLVRNQRMPQLDFFAFPAFMMPLGKVPAWA